MDSFGGMGIGDASGILPPNFDDERLNNNSIRGSTSTNDTSAIGHAIGSRGNDFGAPPSLSAAPSSAAPSTPIAIGIDPTSLSASQSTMDPASSGMEYNMDNINDPQAVLETTIKDYMKNMPYPLPGQTPQERIKNIYMTDRYRNLIFSPNQIIIPPAQQALIDPSKIMEGCMFRSASACVLGYGMGVYLLSYLYYFISISYLYLLI